MLTGKDRKDKQSSLQTTRCDSIFCSLLYKLQRQHNNTAWQDGVSRQTPSRLVGNESNKLVFDALIVKQKSIRTIELQPFNKRQTWQLFLIRHEITGQTCLTI